MPDRRYRALLIGNAVFRRDPQGLPKLQGPRADVDALFDALSDNESGLFAAEDVEALIDRNVQNLREELHRFFIEDATRDDVLFLYYSGHGKLDLLGRLHLCASDTRVNALPVTALRYKEDIDGLIEASPAPATVTILDCCHSGAFRGGELKVKANGKGRCVITSASANELALDALGPGGTSPFTNALVAGLRFAQAEDHLTAQSLYDYVETELGPAGNASPQFYFDGEGAIALAKRLPRQEPAAPAAAAAIVLPAIALPGAIGEPVAKAPAAAPEPGPAGLTLPQPRTLLWELLNEAAESSLSGDGDEETGELLAEVIEAAVPLDVRWPMAVLKRSGEGPGRQVIVEALARGLVKKDISEALQFARGFAISTPEFTGARLAIAAALPEALQDLARSLLEEAISSAVRGRDVRKSQMILRLLELRCHLDDPESSNSEAGLAWAAKSLAEANPDIWITLAEALDASIGQEQDQAIRMPIQADAALRYALFDARAARHLFFFDAHLLHETAFKRLPIRAITRGAAAILAIDASTGHRLLEIAERRCRSQEDWIEFFDTLIDLLRASPGPDQANAAHLISMVERASDRVTDDEWWQLASAAEALVTSAPESVGRLLRLDPDEDRMRRNLIRAAKQTATVDMTAARHLAAAAERLVLSILDESEQARELVDLAEAFAAIDPDRAIQLLMSMPAIAVEYSIAITNVAAIFAAAFPERIETLVDLLDPGDGTETWWVTDVYEGVAKVDPDWALREVEELPGSREKNSVIAQAAITLASTAPERAADLAFEAGNDLSGSHALLEIVRIIMASSPEQGAAIAQQIPDSPQGPYARITALCSVGKAIIEQDPNEAEALLELAERTAYSMDDDCRKGSLLCDIADAYVKLGTASLRASKLLTRAEACASANADDDDDRRTRLLSEVMIGWAAIAPARAERIAEAIADDWSGRNPDLRKAAIAMAPSDPRRAEKLTSMISDQEELLLAQAALVEEFCKSAPARAERLALAMEPGEDRARALLAVAQAEVQRQSW
ncbi:MULTISPECIES: caspase family protein [Glycomyces]|uniref:Caspase family protein n=2 Tax=Glycomyces TaxID=58113 RepID=A0A9X3SWH2_9ACTN|nr:caspase family protein [Glycomyces lechevalierae]MDA1384076.1 caspase family protein [Glycomyces lechevalierae]MDR7339495.1 hypothetical protein [Glycomyces lechevalierae]